MNPTPIDEDLVRDALRQVLDPEAGMNIVDLGLVYGIQVTEADGVQLQITMTSAACPMAEMILDEAQAAVEAVLPPATPVAAWIRTATSSMRTSCCRAASRFSATPSIAAAPIDSTGSRSARPAAAFWAATSYPSCLAASSSGSVTRP